MAAIQIPDKIDQQFEDFAHHTGESKEQLVREALLSYLEDRRDAATAAERLKNIGQRTSLADIGKELAWLIEFSEGAKRDFRKLDKPVQRRIFQYLNTRIAPALDPKIFG